MKSNYVDVHCHMEEKIFDKDREQILKECNQKKILVINCPGKPDAGRKALKLAKKFSNFKVCLGIYPVQCSEMSEKEFWDELKFIEKNKDKIVGIGEVGLDFYWVHDEVNQNIQVERFQEIIWLANKLKLPLNVHSRNAETEVIALLIKTAHVPVVIHSYGGDLELARLGVKHGFYFPISPIVVRSRKHQRLVEAIPIDNLLTETDAPYLGPTKDRNDPRNIPMTVEKIAEIKKMSVEEVRKHILKNTEKIFKLT